MSALEYMLSPETLAQVAHGYAALPKVHAYGLHLVFVRDRSEPRLLILAEIRKAVREKLLAARRREGNQAFYKTLRDRYTVVVERPQGEQRLASADSAQ